MRTIKILILLAAIGGVVYVYRGELGLKLPELSEWRAEIKQIEQSISAPGPLRYERESDQSFLTRGGTVEWTNKHRAEHSLSALAANAKLHSAAAGKLQNM